MIVPARPGGPAKVEMKGIDFSEHGQVMKLDLGKEQSHVFAGNAAKDFKAMAAFKFLGL